MLDTGRDIRRAFFVWDGTGELPGRLVAIDRSTESFDFGVASLREATPTLRMTRVFSITRKLRMTRVRGAARAEGNCFSGYGNKNHT